MAEVVVMDSLLAMSFQGQKYFLHNTSLVDTSWQMQDIWFPDSSQLIINPISSYRMIIKILLAFPI